MESLAAQFPFIRKGNNQNQPLLLNNPIIATGITNIIQTATQKPY